MANTENLQDLILKEVRREHTAVTMFLMNGFQLKGIETGRMLCSCDDCVRYAVRAAEQRLG